MIQRRIFDGPEPASPENSGEPLKDNGNLRADGVLVPFLVGVHLGNHVLEEQQRSVIDGRQPGAKTTGETHLLVLLLDDVLLIFPLHAKGRVGQQVMGTAYPRSRRGSCRRPVCRRERCCWYLRP